MAQAAYCCWVLSALISEVTCQDVQDSLFFTCLSFPCFGFQRDLCFGFGHLRIYIDRSYCEDFCSKPNGVFWEITDLSNINAAGDPERKVILMLEIWELCGTEQWGGNTFEWANFSIEHEISQRFEDVMC